MAAETVMMAQSATAMSSAIKEEATSDTARGRRRTRDSLNDDEEEDCSGEEETSGGTGSSKKRRRSRKSPDKKFECPHEGCGKSYSRAEHLYRHQLNHNPKQIYHCDFPDCHRSFVRQDLCARHKERHTARGSQLLRKDTFVHNLNPIVTAALSSQKATRLGNAPGTLQIRTGDAARMTPSRPNDGYKNEANYMVQSPDSVIASLGSAGSGASPPTDSHLYPPSEPGGGEVFSCLTKSKSNEDYRTYDGTRTFDIGLSHSGMPSKYISPRNEFGFNPYNNPMPARSVSGTLGSPVPRSQVSVSANGTQTFGPSQSYSTSTGPTQLYSPSAQTNGHYSTYPAPSFQSYRSYPMSSMPPSGYATTGPSHGSGISEGTFTTSPRSRQNGLEGGTSGDIKSNGTTSALLEYMASSSSMPVFGGEGYDRSPFAMADDFTAWLFNDSQPGPSPSTIGSLPNGMPVTNIGASASLGLQAPLFSYNPVASGQHNESAPHPMAVQSILDSGLPGTALSEEKRQSILHVIDTRFRDDYHSPVHKPRDEVLEGDRDDNRHMLSLHMMQAYVGLYWLHFHPQMPILHRPTFSAETCPDLLIIAIMALGASCLEKTHGYEKTQACSELANFLAWHLRWEIFMDADFRPPAKLWVFHTLLLLEYYEKMYSTRPLHERAHIHHATTLTLMRRGSSLIGRCALDSPRSATEGRRDSGSINVSGVNTPDSWWNHWITNEATRRTAFAAFVMDSIHATMFGHSAVLVAHEMRLPLPCDEALWSATSSAEVGRLEANYLHDGIKPVTFLDGLKKMLSNQSVRTNSFGRVILMAGLLSVSWHMNQRDLQVSSLGVTQALGGRDRWRGSLTRAFDFWKDDFDRSLAASSDRSSATQHHGHGVDDDNVFESRTVLHHLAHMAMHVDIVDCQIFAGASRLLGRSITPGDYAGAQRRMKEGWAPYARARDATFYALRFLSLVLMPEDHGMPPLASLSTGFDYSARDDMLLNRPWVLYFAALIVWCYGYALDGPIKPLYSLSTHEEWVRDMQGFLRRVGGVRAPDDLATMSDRNACLGLLMLMRDMFRQSRWELLHEASNLLGKCVEMLSGSTGPC